MQDATTANLLRQLDDPTKGQPWQTIPHAASGVKSQTLGPEGGQLQSSQNTLGSIGASQSSSVTKPSPLASADHVVGSSG